MTDYVYDWASDLENKTLKQEISIAAKKSESINKPMGVSGNKHLEPQKSANLIPENKPKKFAPIPMSSSIQNKKHVLTSANNFNKQPIVSTNTIGPKHEIKTFAAKTKTLAGIMGSDLEAMGTKISGPKISVVKR